MHASPNKHPRFLSVARQSLREHKRLFKYLTILACVPASLALALLPAALKYTGVPINPQRFSTAASSELADRAARVDPTLQSFEPVFELISRSILSTEIRSALDSTTLSTSLPGVPTEGVGLQERRIGFPVRFIHSKVAVLIDRDTQQVHRIYANSPHPGAAWLTSPQVHRSFSITTTNIPTTGNYNHISIPHLTLNTAIYLLVTAACAVLTIVALKHKTTARRLAGRCPRCGYPNDPTSQQRCPECGRTINPSLSPTTGPTDQPDPA